MANPFAAIVVGAGPAGLSAAAELADTHTLLIDQGPRAPLRRRDSADEILCGIGGAGLFSDGKHSFFPSASALWTLPDREALSGAYESTVALLGKYGVRAGPLPQETAPEPEPGVWQEKHYPALYVGFAARLACIEALWGAAPERRADCEVLAAERHRGEIVLTLRESTHVSEVRSRRVLVAGGRWSPRWMRPWLEALGVRYAFQRVEFGVRLESDAANELFASLPGVDGKIRFVDPVTKRELRTFCNCRDGEVVLGRAGGIYAYSGRADGPKTGRSNVGLVVRTHDVALARDVERTLYSATPERFPLEEWLERGPSRVGRFFGEAGAAALTEALERLLERTPALTRRPVSVYAPCIEGVGDFPVSDAYLALAPGAWIAGDAVGRFRGIVASMVSGRYAARRIRRELS